MDEWGRGGLSGLLAGHESGANFNESNHWQVSQVVRSIASHFEDSFMSKYATTLEEK